MERIILVVALFICIQASAQKRPVIGISDTHKDASSAVVPRSYVNAILLTGGIPVVIPLMNDDNDLIELLNSLNGIVFTGGEDFDPTYYNERPIPQMGAVNASRDRFDIKLLHLAAERGIPILGICRGIQLINIAFGGSLYQDLPAQYYDTSIRHRQRQSSAEASHSVIVEDNTIFADIVKERMLMVNSSHHQAVKVVAKGFRIAGKSPDNIVEAIEKMDDEHWILGVQFHPEMRVTSDIAMRRIFQRFMQEASALEGPNRTFKPIIAVRPSIDRDIPQPTPSNNISNTTVIYKTVIDTQYVYKSVIDTQYIVRYVHDTLYVKKPADTVIIKVPETKVVYVKDTVYVASSAVTADKPLSAVIMEKPITEVIVEKPIATVMSDTLIFTPGDPALVPASKKSDIESLKKNKRQEKTTAKQAKKEINSNAKQNRKDLIKKEKQNEKVKKKKDNEQIEKEKFEKKLATEQEKQFQRQQKENEKIDKQELKASQKKEKEQK